MTNIAELLRNAPKGLKLYSPLFGEVRLVCVNCDNNILVETEMYDNHYFAYNGVFRMFGCYLHSECLLFPSKDCRTWEVWKLPVEPKFKVGDWIVQNDNGTVSQITKTINAKDEYGEYHAYEHTNGYFAACFENEFHLWTISDAKDGDVLVTTKIRNCPFIYRKTDYNNDLAYYYAGVDGNGDFCEGCLKRTICHFGPVEDVAPSTKEQCDLLFAKMKEAGYQWDADKKELRKIQPHYDIKNFHVGMPVLVRADNNCRWDYSVFSRITGNESWQFAVCNGVSFTQCIPFEGNEHLLGTTDMCDKQYINW